MDTNKVPTKAIMHTHTGSENMVRIGCLHKSEFHMVVFLTVPTDLAGPMLEATAIYGRIWLETSRPRKNRVQASILSPSRRDVFREAPLEEGLGPFPLCEKHLCLPWRLLPCPWT